MTDTALDAADLGSRLGRRGRRPALDGCAFALPAARVRALVGPNGAGKSTPLAPHDGGGGEAAPSGPAISAPMTRPSPPPRALSPPAAFRLLRRRTG